jgi:4-amino-4-deoxy-L-arabinose transferase-like glycosyltransferase
VAVSTEVAPRTALPLPSGIPFGWLRRRVCSQALEAQWELPALVGLLAGTAVLFAWNLAASGWANAYYSAAVLAGSHDWTAFLFGSFDASNAITVDKTPAALWVMSLSARIFGFSSWSVLLPQALEGVAAVWLLYLAVRRRAGPAAGLIAGAVLALTPVATLMFRYNNPDALLTLLLVLAAYATIRALEVASTRWLVVAGAAIGLAFLAKMLQGFLLIPAFAAVYLFAAPTTFWRRTWQVGAAAAAVAVSAGWWVVLVLLWPAAARPYIGGSQTNSILELILGYNGLGRLTGNEVGRVGGGPAPGGGPFSDGAGWLRLFQGELASQVSWLLPVALVSLVALLWARRASARTDPILAQALVWGGWLLTTGLVFSLMQGIFHPYYAVVLVPPIGALLGIAIAEGWTHWNRTATRIGMAAGVALSAGWTVILLSRSPGWNAWLVPAVVGGALTVAAMLLYAQGAGHGLRVLMTSAGVVVLLAASAMGSLATASQAHRGAIPVAQPTVRLPRGSGRLGIGLNRPSGGSRGFAQGGARQFQGFGPGGGPPQGPGAGALAGGPGSGGSGSLLDARAAAPALVAALQADAARYRWVAATTGSENAAGLALSSGEPVMAIGGFNGSDPSPTLAEFQARVAAGEIHFYVATSDAAGFLGTRGGSIAAAEISVWVAEHYTPTTIGGTTVYDLSGPG